MYHVVKTEWRRYDHYRDGSPKHRTLLYVSSDLGSEIPECFTVWLKDFKNYFVVKPEIKRNLPGWF